MTKKVTITDLAKKAGVSVTTVSQILNGKDARFSTKTIEKVKALQKDMGYIPDFNAQNLISKTGKTIGVLIPSLSNPFFAIFSAGIQNEARKEEYVPLVFASNNDRELENQYLLESIRRAADGMIISSPVSDVDYIDSILSQNHIPYILIDQAPSAQEDPIDVANYEGGAKVANYLLENGHTRIVIVAGDDPTVNIRKRLQGFRDAFKDHGVTISDNQIIYTHLSKKGGYDVSNKAVAAKPTAIFAVNDELAIGLYRGIKEAGLRIPDDISVVGYDDIDWAKYVDPKLSTVHQPALEMGQAAAKLIIERIESGNNGSLESGRKISLPIQLIKRGSVKKIN